MILLETAANVATIPTALIATLAAAYVWRDARQKRVRLEQYLKAEKVAGSGKGQRTILHLMANVGLTEAEILHASFGSNRVARKLGKDEKTGLANVLLLEYTEQPSS
jgi:hypothetical protein